MIQETRSYEELARIVQQVDDVLVVDWIAVEPGGDYRKALADMVQFNIAYALYCATDTNADFYLGEAK